MLLHVPDSELYHRRVLQTRDPVGARPSLLSCPAFNHPRLLPTIRRRRRNCQGGKRKDFFCILVRCGRYHFRTIPGYLFIFSFDFFPPFRSVSSGFDFLLLFETVSRRSSSYLSDCLVARSRKEEGWKEKKIPTAIQAATCPLNQ